MTELVSLFDRYKVDYVCTGDYHGFGTVRRRDTCYVISGGGGAHLKRGPFGTFHHLVVFRVSQDSVEECLLVLRKRFGLEDRFESFALGRAYPFMRSQLVPVLALDLMLACILIWFCRMAIFLRNMVGAAVGAVRVVRGKNAE